MPSKNNNDMYYASDYGKKEEATVNLFKVRRDDAKIYFEQCIKPRLDRSYKLYIADNTDRSKEIKKWQANVSVPYIQAVVETLKPRILDARPEFTVQGRNEDDQLKSPKLQQLLDYTWEKAGGDNVAELVTSSSLIYGMGYMQVSWKKDVRKLKFLKTKDISKKKYDWKEETKTFYDAPTVEWVDNYSLWYDWHNTEEENKQDWFKRLVLSEEAIVRRYPMADKKKLAMAFAGGNGSVTDYAAVRTQVKKEHEKITKGSDYNQGGTIGTERFQNSEIKLHEVFEWTRPFDDEYAVMVNDVPILKGGSIPIPYDFKESMFVGVPYLKIPGEYEGYGLPMILENPQIMLNMIKNQRLDAVTLSIHKMWVVNPLANIKKDELVARPFGIIYSTDPNGAREIQMSDVNSSAYKEDEALKGDMRYASGVDDFSMGSGGGGASATEVRHLRESTLERVRLFVNHLGHAYSKVMRYWISMYNQFYSKEMVIRIVGDDGREVFPIIEKDDLTGEFDYKSMVIPSIAGQSDVKKKQDMDLYQLLSAQPFVDPEKLTSKLLHDWNWDFEQIKKGEEQPMMPETGMASLGMDDDQSFSDADRKVLAMFGDESINQGSPLAELSSPVNLLKTGGVPPTPKGVQTTNPRGLNRGAGSKVNTNIALSNNTNPEAQLQNRALNIQS
jgi:hypothetical protein